MHVHIVIICKSIRRYICESGLSLCDGSVLTSDLTMCSSVLNGTSLTHTTVISLSQLSGKELLVYLYDPI